MSATENPTVHGTAVFWLGRGIFIQGPSGSGKSQLALALMSEAQPAELVADDRVIFEIENGQLTARAPHALSGLIERFGWGIENHAPIERAFISLVVSLVPAEQLERMPESDALIWRFGEIAIPQLYLPIQPINAPASIRAILARI